MTIKISCPNCDQGHTLADTLAGKKIRCKGCNEPFTVEEPNEEATDETEEEESPKKKKSNKGSKPAKKGGGAMLWILLGGGGVAALLFLLCAGGGGAALWYFNAGKGVTLANYNKLHNGMTEAEVTAILGSPTRTENAGPMSKSLIWESGRDSITVGFLDGKVWILAAVIDKQIYIGNNNAEASNTKPAPTNGGKTPDPGGGKTPDPGGATTPGVSKSLNRATANMIGKEGHKSEAEIIALVGSPPKRLGPQPMIQGGQSTDTLLWTDGGRGVLKVYIVNGAWSGHQGDNLR